MGFIPQEAKDKIAQLEAENKKLKDAASSVKEVIKPSVPSPWLIVFGFGWLITIGYLVFLLFFSTSFYSVTPDVIPTRDSLVIYQDGQLTKVDRVSDDGLIYRVQIGAFEGPQWDLYKNSFDNLHAYGKVDDFEKISMGAFTRLEDAQDFQAMLSTLGMDFAYIVAYLDGEPIGLIKAKAIEKDTQ